MILKNEIKSYIAASGLTMTDIVKQMNSNRPKDKQMTLQNLSNKLTRGTIKYNECLEIAEIIGYEIIWEPKTSVGSSMRGHLNALRRWDNHPQVSIAARDGSGFEELTDVEEANEIVKAIESNKSRSKDKIP